MAGYGGPFHPWTRDETQLRHFEADWSAEDRLGMVYLVSPDQVSHLYWPFVEPAVERALRQDPEARMRAAERDLARQGGRRAFPYSDAPMTPEDFAEGAAQVPLVYDWMDEALGRVLARIDPATTTLLVVSDHGFESGRRSPVLTGGHRDPAVLLAWGRRADRAPRPPARRRCWTWPPPWPRCWGCRAPRTGRAGPWTTSSTCRLRRPPSPAGCSIGPRPSTSAPSTRRTPSCSSSWRPWAT